MKYTEVVSQMIIFSEIYLGRNLTTREISELIEIEKVCHFDFPLLHFLFDYCINKKKCNFTYMRKVAINWKERGITTLADAEYAVSTYAELAAAVSSAFGISNRMLASAELHFVEEWVNQKIAKELVVEACNRTILHTSKASFPYANKILENWRLAGVNKLSDLNLIDEVHSIRCSLRSQNVFLQKFKKN